MEDKGEVEDKGEAVFSMTSTEVFILYYFCREVCLGFCEYHVVTSIPSGADDRSIVYGFMSIVRIP